MASSPIPGQHLLCRPVAVQEDAASPRLATALEISKNHPLHSPRSAAPALISSCTAVALLDGKPSNQHHTARFSAETRKNVHCV